MEILNKRDQDPEAFLHMRTGGETRPSRYKPENKAQSKQRLPRAVKSKGHANSFFWMLKALC